MQPKCWNDVQIAERSKRSPSGKTSATLLLRPILLYGHESWVTTKRLDSRIQAVDTKVLPTNKMCHKERQNPKCTHADIYEEFHIKPILDVIKVGKFIWLGHVMRREPPSMLHEVVNYKVRGTRPRGRPRTTWL